MGVNNIRKTNLTQMLHRSLSQKMGQCVLLGINEVISGEVDLITGVGHDPGYTHRPSNRFCNMMGKDVDLDIFARRFLPEFYDN